MNTVKTVEQLRAAVRQARTAGQRIGLVPTMGNLHDGHLSLVRTALANSDFVIASIFVNPLQFGPNEDLASYPRTLVEDQQKLQAAGCHLLFAPGVEDMYPHGQAQMTLVSVPEVSEGLCGGSRPGHFTGVATVVSKLFNMAQPDIAVFGEKDFQQLAVIRRLVRDLDIPVDIIGEPIARASDGLALSSRNGYLSTAERATAPQLHRILSELADAIRAGEHDFAVLVAQGRARLEQAGFRPDYLEIRDNELRPAGPQSRHLVLLAAAFLGRTRLIDNLQLVLDGSA